MARGLPLEPDAFNILILNYTMKCPLACDYCCYSCGPRRAETMDLDLALSLVDQAARLGVFSECGFTGGEPLLFSDDILQITERMASYGLPFSMISACDWATDAASTAKMIDPLLRNGMSVFTVSHDPSHEKWVSRDNVRRAAERVLDSDARLVICGSFYDESSRLQTMFPELVGHPRIDMVNRLVLPETGRLRHRKLDPGQYPGTDTSSSDACYKRIYHDVTVFWDGQVYPCCSVYNRETPGISYGNVFDSSLAEVWDRIEGSLFLRMIKRDGFRELHRFVAERDPELAETLESRDGTIGPCHLCHLIMGDDRTSRRIHRLFEELEKERVASILATVTRTHGDDVTAAVISSAMGS